MHTTRRVAEHIGKFDTLLEIVKKRMVRLLELVIAKGKLVNKILQGKVEGKSSRGRPARQLDDVKEWTGLGSMRRGGGQRTEWPGESVSVVFPPTN